MKIKKVYFEKNKWQVEVNDSIIGYVIGKKGKWSYEFIGNDYMESGSDIGHPENYSSKNMVVEALVCHYEMSLPRGYYSDDILGCF